MWPRDQLITFLVTIRITIRIRESIPDHDPDPGRTGVRRRSVLLLFCRLLVLLFGVIINQSIDT